MKTILITFAFILLTDITWAQPLPTINKHAIIIDTDCAIDDLRAISILLSRPEITIKAIVLSDGTLPAEEGVQKVRALLHTFGRDSIPVGCGEAIKGLNPDWRDFNRNLLWGDLPAGQISCQPAQRVMEDQLNKATDKITLVCLGPLSNEARLLSAGPDVKQKIDRLIWYNESIKPFKGFNYESDKPATVSVFASGIRIDVVSNLDKNDVPVDTVFLNECKDSKTPLAGILYKVHSQKPVLEKMNQHHFKLADDLVAIYLTNPELFDTEPLLAKVSTRYVVDYDAVAVNEVLDDMISGKYAKGYNVVFNVFPTDKNMFTYDVRQIMDSAIARYGPDEWKANVLTDEFHRHLGVFSIVGAKMGIKAKEFFGVDNDLLTAISFAGSKPPYSCLNDGIQVSTGATLGMGTIKLANDTISKPMAIFTYKDRSFMIKLKDSYLKEVDDDINEGIVKFGLMDDGYWKLVRRNAIKYWLEWDRNKIFDIQEVTKQQIDQLINQPAGKYTGTENKEPRAINPD